VERASTGPPLIGGGETCTSAAPIQPLSRASTGPPLIGGGELVTKSPARTVTVALQRVRR